MVTLNWPLRMYCHSAALGCQCSSRKAPAFISSTTPVMVVEMANWEPSTRHSRPPSKASKGFCDGNVPIDVEVGGQALPALSR